MSEENKERKTYIINIDGMRADYFGAEGHQGCLTPTLVSLAKQGVRFTSCKDILPAVTATNHTAIMASTSLGTHGMYGWAGYYKGLDFAHLRVSCEHGTARTSNYEHRHLQSLPTLFDVARSFDSSVVTAIIAGKYWVGEILADKNHDILIYPESPTNPDYVTPSEGYILGGERHEGDSPWPPRLYIPKKGKKTVRPPKGTIWIPPKFLKEINANLLPSDKWTTDQAIQTICHDDPDFMYILLASMDTAGHAYGSFRDIDVSDLCDLINPDAMMDQLYITDTEINRFINFLKSRYNEDEENRFETSRIVITSDHGMSSMKEKTRAVDIRGELAEEGIQIRANTKWRPFGYKDNGQYEWCFSEATHSYIYCRENEQGEIISVLKNLRHVNPELIFDKEKQENNKMWKGNYEDVVWPMILVFLEPNYMTPGYGDEVAAIIPDVPHISSLIAKLFDIPTAPGMHGTTSEQNVPLMFVSPSEAKIPQDVVDNREVSVLDIAPTIACLEWKKIPPTFEGKPLFSNGKIPKPSVPPEKKSKQNG